MVLAGRALVLMGRAGRCDELAELVAFAGLNRTGVAAGKG